MENYRPNSDKYLENEAEAESRVKHEKVISGEIVERKKSAFTKLASLFLVEDLGNIKQYLLEEVIIPSIRDGLYDIIRNGAEMMLGIDTKAGRRTTGPAPKVSYGKYFSQGRNPEKSRDDSETRSRYDFDRFALPTRGDAEAILSTLLEIIDQYDTVTVAELYDLLGIESKYTDTKYGWTSLGSATTKRVPEGYVLKLPTATLL